VYICEKILPATVNGNRWCALCWHAVLSRFGMTTKLIHLYFSDTSTTSMRWIHVGTPFSLTFLTGFLLYIPRLGNMGKATRRTPAPRLLTERNYYSNDVTNREPDIPPTTPHYRDICHRRRYTVHRLHRHLHLSSRRSVADVPGDTAARHGPVHSSQSIESRSHYRSPNNHVLRSLAGLVRDVRGPAKQI